MHCQYNLHAITIYSELWTTNLPRQKMSIFERSCLRRQSIDYQRDCAATGSNKTTSIIMYDGASGTRTRVSIEQIIHVQFCIPFTRKYFLEGMRSYTHRQSGWALGRWASDAQQNISCSLWSKKNVSDFVQLCAKIFTNLGSQFFLR
jgi:hypothetical protein